MISTWFGVATLLGLGTPQARSLVRVACSWTVVLRGSVEDGEEEDVVRCLCIILLHVMVGHLSSSVSANRAVIKEVEVCEGGGEKGEEEGEEGGQEGEGGEEEEEGKKGVGGEGGGTDGTL